MGSPTTAQLFSSPNSTQLHTDLPSSSVFLLPLRKRSSRKTGNMADRYSFSLTTFSPSGKLVQIEYALNAVNQGITALGIKATNGIVLATEKKSSSPLAELSFENQQHNTRHRHGVFWHGSRLPSISR